MPQQRNASTLYTQNPVPDKADDLPRYIDGENNAISIALDNINSGMRELVNKEPPRPRDGMHVVADGVNWDPIPNGGTVTQSTDKSTAVTSNSMSGLITMNNAALAANTTVQFTLNNSQIAATDVVTVMHESAGTLGAYNIVSNAAAGSALISVRNITGGSLSQAIKLRYVVNKDPSASGTPYHVTYTNGAWSRL